MHRIGSLDRHRSSTTRLPQPLPLPETTVETSTAALFSRKNRHELWLHGDPRCTRSVGSLRLSSLQQRDVQQYSAEPGHGDRLPQTRHASLLGHTGGGRPVHGLILGPRQLLQPRKGRGGGDRGLRRYALTPPPLIPPVA
jgi:hypothetical protein